MILGKKILRCLGLIIILQLGSCSTATHHAIIQDGPPTVHIDVDKIPNATPKYEPLSRYGNPHSYVALGKRYYVLRSAKGYNKVGYASWYGMKFHKKLTSTRESYSLFGMTAASTTLPLPCYVRVTNLENGKSVIVRVNDRGPFKHKRILDLSFAAAKKLGYANKGTALVRVVALTSPRDWRAATWQASTSEQHQNHSPLYLQVGAFSDRLNAEHLKERVANLTHKPVSILSENHVYKVKIGPLFSVSESHKLNNILQQHGLNNVISVVG